MKVAIISNYTFSKTAKTVTFTDFASITLDRVLSITNVTNGVQIYYYRMPGYTGSVATNILTLAYNTNTPQFNDTDKLHIEYLADNYGETMLASGARTATFNGSEITNYDARGASFIVNVTAASGDTPTLVMKLQMKDVASGNWVDIPGAVTSSIATTGQTLITIYPGLTASANSKVDYPLPRAFRGVYTISGTTPSFTFSVGVHYLN